MQLLTGFTIRFECTAKTVADRHIFPWLEQVWARSTALRLAFNEVALMSSTQYGVPTHMLSSGIGSSTVSKE